MFISRSLSEDHPIRRFCGASEAIELIDRSLIAFEPITPPPPDFTSFDAVFLNSPQAAKRFFEAFPTVKLPIYALGEGTARHAAKAADVAFFGKGDVHEALQQLTEALGSKKVLIPRGIDSKRRLQNALPESQFEEVVLYRTRANHLVVPTCDVYTFTSPSNVRSFFEVNQIPPEARVIAIGHSTAEQLSAYGVKATLATNYRPDGMWYAIFSAIHS